MFHWSLPPVVCRRDQVLFMLFVFVCVLRCQTRLGSWVTWRSPCCSSFSFLCCVVFFFVCLRPVYYVPNVASVSGLSILDDPSAFSSVCLCTEAKVFNTILIFDFWFWNCFDSVLVRKDMDVNEYERLFNYTLRHNLK